MEISSSWMRILRGGLAGRGMTPLTLLLLIGGGSAVLMLVCASRLQRTERVPLSEGVRFSASDFRTAQAQWQTAGLTEAQFSGGAILVPAEHQAAYRQSWQPPGEAANRSRWADAWQSANQRLSQFSGAREREAARDISRAQTVSHLLEQLPDIAAADVVWDETEATGWRTPERARATVYLQARPGRTISPDVIDAVRRAVSGSKANLSPADVTVMDQTRMLTYDGSGTSAAQSQVVQLAAMYRSRLESALEHIPGVRVQVHANAAPSETTDATPVALAVSIPEESLRTLARLDGETPLPANSPAAQRRREVFRTVEQHIHQSIRDKAALLIPPGLTLAAASQVAIETIPAQPAPTPPVRTKPMAVAGWMGWLEGNLLPLTALLCGAGAVWMLRPGVSQPEIPADSDASPPAAERPTGIDSHEASDHPAANPRTASSTNRIREPSGHSSTVDLSDVSEAVTALQAAAARRKPPVSASAENPFPEHATPDRSPVIEAASAPPATPIEATPTHDALRDALSKLAQRTSSTAAEAPLPPQVASHAHRPESVPTVVAGRIGPAPAPPSSRCSERELDLEDLSHESPDLVQEIVRRVDVLVWSRALFGASAAVQSRILPHLSASDAQRLTRELRTNRPLRLREIDAAQETVRETWWHLRQELPVDSASPV